MLPFAAAPVALPGRPFPKLRNKKREESMRIAVTGGAGFLGYHLARQLGGAGHSVRLLDIVAPPEEDSETPPDFRECDVRDRDALVEAFADCDAVVHAAAALPLWKREEIYSTNIDGTENVLSVCRELGIDRVVHISSTAVYGVPDKHPLDEDDPMVGVGPYGETKIVAEEICDRYRQSENGGLCVCIVRPKTFVGSGRLGVFQILYEWVEEGKRIPAIGDGRNRYQLLEVQDLVDSIYLGLTVDPERANQTFNIGAERFSTVREDMGALCEHAGTGARVIGTPARLVKLFLAIAEKLKISPLYKWVYGTADRDSFVSIERAKRELGWQPRYSNAEALIHSYDWYMANKASLPTGSGITHRVGWDQGVLKILKKLS